MVDVPYFDHAAIFEAVSIVFGSRGMNCDDRIFMLIQ